MNDPYLKNAALLSGAQLPRGTNQPAQYTGRGYRYFEQATVDFTAAYAKYAANYVQAEAQGLDPDHPEEWRTVGVRLADAISMPSTGEKRTGDYQKILVDDPTVDYIPPGSKWKILGSVWLALNPDNLGAPGATSLLCRCNAVWNHLDFYGNLLSEPIFVQNPLARASAPENQGAVKITTGYFNIICQLNPWTAQLNTNSRLLLGKGAYAIRGYTDFLREFTGEETSARLVQFTAEYTEPDPIMDDLERKVAGGKALHWELSLTGPSDLAAGMTAAFSVTAFRNGEKISSSDTYPISFLWETQNPEIASVDDAGQVTAHAAGETLLTVSLAQNPAVSVSLPLSVNQAGGAVFLQTGPDTLYAWQSALLEAAFFAGGQNTGQIPEWRFSGPDKSAFSVQTDGARALISCYAGSVAPLTVEAVFPGGTVSRTIRLLGL